MANFYIKGKSRDELDKKKKETKDWFMYWKKNIDNFYKFNRLIFDTTLSQDEISALKAQMKTQLEFNIMQPYLMRQLGEFLRQEPSFSIRASDCAENVDPILITVVEGHIICSITESNQNNELYKVARDMFSGGFGALKVYTKYKAPRSFDQVICFKAEFDPALCVFDSFSREPHRGDGRFSGSITPYRKDEFEEMFGTEFTKEMKFSGNLSSFNWAYKQGSEAFVLVEEEYYKVRKKAKFVKLITGEVMTTNEYEEFVEKWNKNPMNTAQAPGVVGRPKEDYLEEIRRCYFTDNAILDQEDTDFKYLPNILFSGNSVMNRESSTAKMEEMTPPYLKNMEGLQRLTNYCGNTIASDIENMIQHKLMMPKDGIPAEYSDAYINFQVPNIVIYNQYKDNDLNVPLNKPEVIPRVPLPTEVMQMFTGANSIAQTIMGSYDASLGISNNQLSGEAIQSGAMMSNATTMPYMAGYLTGMNRLAEHYVDLIPKLYVTPRTIPIRDPNGKRQYVLINGEGGVKIEYNSDALEVKVESGVNFEVQRERAFSMLTNLMKITPVLNEYIGNTEQGIEMMLDNVDIRGIDNLKQGIKPFLQKKQQQAAQTQQQAMMLNPQVLKQQELKQKEMQMQLDSTLKSAQVNVEQEKAATDRMMTLAKMGEMTDNTTLRANEIQAENARTAVQAATQMADLKHTHAMDVLNLHHKNQNSKNGMNSMKENLSDSDNKSIEQNPIEKKKRGRPKKEI